MKHQKLFEAIKKGNLDFLVEKIKKNPELVNAKNSRGSTVLQELVSHIPAVRKDNYENIFNYLITLKEVDLNARDGCGHGLLIYLYTMRIMNRNHRNNLNSLLAISSFNAKMEGDSFFQSLIANLRHEHHNNFNCFSHYAYYIDRLIMYGVNINIKEQNRTLLQEFLANLYQPCYYKQFPIILNEFLKRGALIDFNIIQDLYSYKDIPVKSYSHFLDKNGDSVLHLFAKHFTKQEDNDFLKILLSCDPQSLYDRNRDGDTVMHIIASKIRERRADLYGSFLNSEKIEEDEIIKDLKQIIKKIKHIVDPIKKDFGKINEITNKIGETSSEIINSDLFDMDSFELMTEAKARLLLKQLNYFSAKETLDEKDNFTAFESKIGLQSELKNIISTSLTLSNVNMQDYKGNTALHLALKGKNLILALALMEHNPDKYITNCAGDLPIHFAAEQGMFQEEILKIYNIEDFNIRNANGLDSFELLALNSLANIDKIINPSGLKIEEQNSSYIPFSPVNHFKRGLSSAKSANLIG